MAFLTSSQGVLLSWESCWERQSCRDALALTCLASQPLGIRDTCPSSWGLVSDLCPSMKGPGTGAAPAQPHSPLEFPNSGMDLQNFPMLKLQEICTDLQPLIFLLLPNRVVYFDFICLHRFFVSLLCMRGFKYLKV